MEFMDGGSLTQVLDQYKYLKLTEEQIALIMGEVRSFKTSPSDD